MRKLVLLLAIVFVVPFSIVTVSAQIGKNHNAVDFPDPYQPNSTVLPPFFKLHNAAQTGACDAATLKGIKDRGEEIVRVLHRGNYSVILTHKKIQVNGKDRISKETYKITGKSNKVVTKYYYTAKLYLVKHDYDYFTGKVTNKLYTLNYTTSDNPAVGAKSIPTQSTTKAGHYCNLSDIAFSADGYLIGCNNVRCFYHSVYEETKDFGSAKNQDDKSVDYGKGVLYFYVWNITFEALTAKIENGIISGTDIGVDDYCPTVLAKQGHCDKTSDKIVSGTVTDIGNNHYPTERDRWTKLDDPYRIDWTTANYTRADAGYTMAVSGNYTSTDDKNPFWITFSAAKKVGQIAGVTIQDTISPSTLRFVHVPFVNKTMDTRNIVSSKSGTVAGEVDVTKEFDIEKNLGDFYELDNSPYSNKSWVIDGPISTPYEFIQYDGQKKTQRTQPKGYSWDYYSGQDQWESSSYMDTKTVGKYPVSPNFFRYGKRNVLIYPIQEGDAITGVRMYDMRTKLSDAQPLQLLGLPGALRVPTTEHHYVSAFGQVDTTQLTVYVFIDTDIYTYTTKNVEQGRGVFAYDLESKFDPRTNDYIFNFKVNEYPWKAVLKLYDKNKQLIHSHNLITNGALDKNYIQKAVNPGEEYEVKIAGNKLTDKPAGTKFTWSIEVTDTTVYNWGILHEEIIHTDTKSNNKECDGLVDGVPEAEAISGRAYYVYHTIDKNIASPYFGNIYRMDHYTKDNASKTDIRVIDPTTYEAKSKSFPTEQILTTPMRLAVDSTGLLYVSEYNYNVSNIYTVYPEDVISGSMNKNKLTPFLTAENGFTHNNTTGDWTTKDGKLVMSEISGLAITGREDGTKLWVASSTEHAGKNNHQELVCFDIGKLPNYLSGGKPQWTGEPSFFHDRSSLGTDNAAKGKADIIPSKKGIIVGKVGDEAIANKPTFASLTVYDEKNPANTLVYNSGNSPTTTDEDKEILYRLTGGAGAVTKDGNYFVMVNTLDGQRRKTADGVSPAQYDFSANQSEIVVKKLDDMPASGSWSNVYSCDFAWNDPFLERQSQKTGNLKASVRQMNFDRGGNLIMTGRYGFYRVYAMPNPQVTTRLSVKKDVTPAALNSKTIVFDYVEGETDSGYKKYLNRFETPVRPVASQDIYQLDDYDRVFDNGGGDGEWKNPDNWFPNPGDPQWLPNTPNGTPATLEDAFPKEHHRVRLDAAVTVTGQLDAKAGYIDINKESGKVGKLTIAADGALTVGGHDVYDPNNDATAHQNEGRISSVPKALQNPGTNPTSRDDRSTAAVTDIVIQSSAKDTDKGTADGQGALALHNQYWTGATPVETKATVQLAGRYVFKEKESNPADLTWQYVGIPFNEQKKAEHCFNGSWMYEWHEDEAYWEILAGRGHYLQPFTGYILTQDEAKTYSLAGTLAYSGERVKTLSYTETTKDGNTKSYAGANFLANSWTAPIQITSLEEADFYNCKKTVYLYAPAKDKRQYRAIPIHQTNALGIHSINPLQGFFVLAIGSGATVKLDYAKHVSKEEQPAFIPDSKLNSDEADQLVDPVPAPEKRMAPAVNPIIEEQEMMRIILTGDDGSSDNVVLFQHPNYTLGFDDGYDGDKILGGEGSPYLAASAIDGDMAVISTPSFDKTTLQFRKGTARTYTLSFQYDVEESDLVLQDLLTRTSVPIVTGGAYTFVAEGDSFTKRFRIAHRDAAEEGYDPEAYIANGKLYIENPIDEVVDIMLYTVDGKMLQHIATGAALSEVELPTITGVYLVAIVSSTGVQTIKHVF